MTNDKETCFRYCEGELRRNLQIEDKYSIRVPDSLFITASKQFFTSCKESGSDSSCSETELDSSSCCFDGRARRNSVMSDRTK